MKKIGIGLIGAGNIAQFHMLGYGTVANAYGDVEPVFVAIADPDLEKAKDMANRMGFQKVTADWKEVVADPAVEAVLITTPNYLHAEMVIAAAEAGKHVMCEKPMAMDKEEGLKMVEAVKKAGVINQVDFIYRQCPAVTEAKKIIEEGKLGTLNTFRGWFDCAYKADPMSPMQWRQYKKYSGTGALGDITAHVISMSDFLVNCQFGEIDEVCAVWDTVTLERPCEEDLTKTAKVDTDDQNYVLVRYKNGRIGIMYSSRIASGCDCKTGFEIFGDKGAVSYDVRRLNELKVYLDDGDDARKAFRTLKANTRHGDYKKYSIYDDMGLSYTEVMGIQAHNFLKAIADNKQDEIDTDIAYGYYVDRVMDAMITSIEEKRWVKIEEML